MYLNKKRFSLLAAFTLSFGFFLASCEKENDTTPTKKVELPTGEWKVNLKHPESIAWDGTNFYVSDFGVLNPSGKDGKGSIAQLDATGKIVKPNITTVRLNKPKGLIVIGNTILVTDIDSLKAINKTTGVLEYAIPFTNRGINFIPTAPTDPAPGLNDIVKGNNETTVYVSLTNNGGIYRVNLASKQVDSIANVPGANGLAYDVANDILYAVGYTTQPSLSKIDLAATTIKAELLPNGYVGQGGLDGLVLVGNKLYISDWGAGATGGNEKSEFIAYDLEKQKNDAITSHLAKTFGKANLNGAADFIIKDNYIIVPALGGGNIYVGKLD